MALCAQLPGHHIPGRQQDSSWQVNTGVITLHGLWESRNSPTYHKQHSHMLQSCSAGISLLPSLPPLPCSSQDLLKSILEHHFLFTEMKDVFTSYKDAQWNLQFQTSSTHSPEYRPLNFVPEFIRFGCHQNDLIAAFVHGAAQMQTGSSCLE